jgi:hypothetical protein
MGGMPSRQAKRASFASDRDEVLEVLDDVVAALKENTERAKRAMERAEQIRVRRKKGMSYSEIADDGYGPLLIRLVTENLQNLADKGSRLRRAHARALYSEGATLQEIAKMYGVTHQRISAIIHSGDDEGPKG